MKITRFSTCAIAAGCLLPMSALADWTLEAGYDTFRTVPGGAVHGAGVNADTKFSGVPIAPSDGMWNGVFIGKDTDTVVERLDDIVDTTETVGATGSSDLIIRKLQLSSDTLWDFGDTYAPAERYDTAYLMLDSNATQTTGSFNAVFGAGGTSGTYTASLDPKWELRKGSLTGPIISTGDIGMDSVTGSEWEIIDGIIWVWPEHEGPHPVLPVPEVSSPFVMAGFLGLAMFMRRNRRQG